MNTFSYLARSGVLTVLVLFGGPAAHGQDLSDLDPTNPDSGLNESVSNVIESLPQLDGPVLRPDDPTCIYDPTGPQWPAGAGIHRITSSESGLWLVPTLAGYAFTMSPTRVCVIKAGTSATSRPLIRTNCKSSVQAGIATNNETGKAADFATNR